MKHLLNICNINGAEVEPVDIITFGSPCQDLSVAGKRAGIQDGERSNFVDGAGYLACAGEIALGED